MPLCTEMSRKGGSGGGKSKEVLEPGLLGGRGGTRAGSHGLQHGMGGLTLERSCTTLALSKAGGSTWLGRWILGVLTKWSIAFCPSTTYWVPSENVRTAGHSPNACPSSQSNTYTWSQHSTCCLWSRLGDCRTATSTLCPRDGFAPLLFLDWLCLCKNKSSWVLKTFIKK